MQKTNKLIKNIITFLSSLPKNVAWGLISLYQATISPDHGWLKAQHPYGFCKFYPSCSEYTKQAVSKYGLLRGGWFSAKRLIKCHPWAKPGIDLIPN